MQVTLSKLADTNRWYHKARQIVIYHKKHGKWPSHNSADPHQLSLGLWKKKLRHYYRQGKLPQQIVKYLRHNNFSFDAMSQWKRQFKSLKDYVKQNHSLPSAGLPLGQWVRSLRYRYDSLPEAKQKLLQSIGFTQLQIVGKKEQYWEEQFRKVVSFFKQHDKLPSRKDDEQLHLWLGALRKKYKQNELPEQQLKRFGAAGINLMAGTFTKQSWEDVFEELQQFIKKYKTLPAGAMSKPNEKRLYFWLLNQRASYKKGKLNKTRISQLQATGFRLFRQ